MSQKNSVLRIHSKDNVIVALTDLSKGDVINYEGDTYVLTTDVPAKHKFASVDLNEGDLVYMYGVLVGMATQPVVKGEILHTHNLVHRAEEYGVEDGEKEEWKAPDFSRFEGKTFQGYHRADGKVGTQNNWLVIPLVFCENRNVTVIENTIVEQLGFGQKKETGFSVDKLVNIYQEGASEEDLLNTSIQIDKKEAKKNKLFPNVDGIQFLRHDGGCGGSTPDSVALCHLLAGYVNNPNVAGATVLSLGCQHAQAKIMQDALESFAKDHKKPLYVLTQQESTSERDFVEEAIKKTFIGLTKANEFVREPAPLSKLVIGLECGGSDGFSGISANPTLGYVSDLVVGLGGTTVLAEFPELNGVEQEMINRCVTKGIADKFSNIMSTYNEKAEFLGGGFHANPSPGNIKDGLITDAIKSAGAAKKGGSSPVTDVLDYTEQITKKGLNLLCTPGNDVESTTGLAGSGCNVILFTTGLGTPTGNPIVPVVKVSSNSKLFNKMNDIIDFNTGGVIEGDTLQKTGEELLEYVIKVASGEKTKAMQLGQNDFIPWKRGMSL
ncbi:altronate hydrolase [Wenyingzhuangia fucanilytica]|uniref:Altronate hydrolase n=1 Tax=Wenyingzhuangia fucanilytica TaxID=1790137 RepID=A0A1B1Y932_9FLAO|nr:altronate dehydratase family protein [Wenyingzhuangia fucanilytica]ANW97290.1 altronate hydrolase [Wenyingzhuangia fucanilytica]